jgi:pyrroline-5-carboxylate reductase
MKKISFLGVGNMGGAVLGGLRSKSYKLGYYSPNSTVEDVEKFQTLADAVAWGDIIILGMKPQIFQTLDFPENKQKIWISLLAGTTINSLKEKLGSSSEIVRTMPNLPLQVGAGATGIALDNTSPEALKIATDIFNHIGLSVSIPEFQMDAITAMSGSGPAYVFQFIDAWINGGILAGLVAPVAKDLALQTLEGVVKMLKESDRSPADFTKQVCSPGGTTIAGVYALEKGGFRGSIMDAVNAAAKRSQELG